MTPLDDYKFRLHAYVGLLKPENSLCHYWSLFTAQRRYLLRRNNGSKDIAVVKEYIEDKAPDLGDHHIILFESWDMMKE